MKKGILKFLAGTAAAVTLVGGMALSALAATEVTDIIKMDKTYYMTLDGENGKLSGNPKLTIEKYKDGDPSKGISGVEFKYAKVGDLYQIVNGNEVSMAFGIGKDFVKEFEIEDAADYYSNGADGELYYYKDIGTVNTGHLQNINVQSEKYASLKDYISKSSSFGSVTTKKDGTIDIPNADYGLYVLVEWDTSKAAIGENPVSLTNTQSPFLVALPTTEKKDDDTYYWEENVKARIKNSSNEAKVEKKIVTENETKTDGSESVDDTDITSIGDTVYFRLMGTVPTIPDVDHGNKEKFKSYILVDNLSKGLTPETVDDGAHLKNVSVRMTCKDSSKYALTAEDYTTVVENYAGDEAEYEGGKTITISLTASGLEKISAWAADTNEKDPKEIYFYYTAMVNENAEIGPNDHTSGPAGNPNEVQLRYKIGSSAEMKTEWDKVTEYTFGIKADKQLAGSAEAVTDSNKENITFALYATKDGKADASDKIYYEMKKAADGAYHVTSVPKTSITENAKMHPAAKGALNIKGLEEGTYFLEELTTVSGYNLLKTPVKIEIKANKGENTYVGSSSQYLGTIDQKDNTDGIFKVTINNTKGFELPSTGGNGIWFFVLAGAFVVAAGCGYYSVTIRKNRVK